MATNYDNLHKTVTQPEVQDLLSTAGVSTDLVNQILKTLGSVSQGIGLGNSDVPVTNFDTIKGHQIVLVDSSANGGELDLTGITPTQLAAVKVIASTGDNNVTFTLDGTVKTGEIHNAVAFKGVVNTLGGDDTIFIHSSQGVTVSAGEGHNVIRTGDDTAVTGSGNDKIIVGDGSGSNAIQGNEIHTGAGNDTVIAGSGNDTITTGAGNDSVTSGDGDDYIDTGANNDTVVGGAGNDTILTGAGNDSISTGTGDDSVDAGAGNDTIYVGAATKGEGKIIDGGAGNDIIKLAAGYIGDATIDGDGGDIGTLANGTNDQLNLSKVVIDDVQLYNSEGVIVDPTFDAKHKLSTDADYKNDLHLKITLQNSDGSTSVLDVQHFEKFVYDTSTADTDGAIKITGVDQFYAQFHHPLS